MSKQQQRNRGRKWIQAEIQSLDPYKDYEEIYRLSSGYGVTDFMNTLIYCLTFPNFIVTQWGSRAVWREDGGKVWHKAGSRIEQTEHTNAIWWWYGPSTEKCRVAVEEINKLHEFHSKSYPGDFGHQEDYIYTMAFSAVLMHRLRLRLGLSGVSEKEQIASYLFWTNMVPLFFSLPAKGGRESLHSWPSDFDGCIKFCEEFEAIPQPGSEQGHLCTEAIFDFFAFKYFPPTLRWIGHSIPVALSLPSTLKAHHIKPVNPLLGWFIRFMFGWLLWFQEVVLPDSQEAYIPMTEARSKRASEQRKKDIADLDEQYIPYFARHRAYESMPQFGGCPYHNILRVKAEAPSKPTKEL